MKKAIATMLITVLLLCATACGEVPQGGHNEQGRFVEVVFAAASGFNASDDDLEAAMSVLENRLNMQNINVQSIDVSSQNTISVRFEWDENYTEEQIPSFLDELCEVAELSFREGNIGYADWIVDEYLDLPIILTGRDVKNATSSYNPHMNKFEVMLEFTESGAVAFADATGRLARESGIISIWLDDALLTAPQVSGRIEGGAAVISGDLTKEEIMALADKINSGALPFALITDSFEIK